MKLNLIASLVIFIITCSACSNKLKKSISSTSEKSLKQVALTSSGAPSLIKTHWSLVMIKGSMVQNPAPDHREAYLMFMPDSTSLTGSGGCNNIFGTFHLKGPRGITFEQIGSTKMFCDNMDNEVKMLGALREVNTWEIKSDSLILKKGGKIPELTFVVSADSSVDK
jgi:heat shock protein HslJ